MQEKNFQNLDEKVWKMCKSLSRDNFLQEDLFQEIRFFLWKTLEDKPGQKDAWYLQRGYWHGQNYLHKIHEYDNRVEYEFQVPEKESSQSLEDEIVTSDLLERLKVFLTPLQEKVLNFLLDGFSVMDIARRLKVNHSYVSRQKTSIQKALVAIQY